MDAEDQLASDGGSATGLAEVDRWTYEVESPFLPAHEIAAMAPGDAELTETEWEPLSEQENGGRPTLRRGSRGPAVRELQEGLNRKGSQLAVDGDFGSLTEEAVRRFQAASGMAVDGVVGRMTWGRLLGQAQPQPTGGGVPDVGADVPTVPLGTLVLEAPGRSFRYAFRREDLMWAAKLARLEAGGEEDAASAAVVWALFNDYAFIKHRRYPTFTDYIRRYSTTLQPVLANWQAAARHYQSPAFVRTGGTYPEAPHIPRGQTQRHLDEQRAPWSSVKASARRLALRALRGELANPGIGNANEFVSTKILYKQKHGENPDAQQWRRFTEQFKRTKMRWIGDVPDLDQTKNAFFLSNSLASVPPGAVRVEPPQQAGQETAQPAAEEAFDAEWDLEDEVDRSEDEAFEALFEDEDEDEAFYEEFDANASAPPTSETFEEELGEDSIESEEALDSEAALAEEEIGFEAAPEVGFEEEVNRRSPPYIRWVQSSLNQVQGAGLTADGAAGPRTQAAVRSFQASSGLTADGIVGANTERALQAAGASPPPSATATPTVSPTTVAPSGGTAPALPPLQGGAPRSSQWIRDAWQGHHCAEARMRPVRVQGWNTPVNALAADAYLAFERALQASGYGADRAWSYVCRTIRQSARPSLHAYGLAIDIDARYNPHRKGRPGPARFASGGTKEQRITEVRARQADTVFTPDQVSTIEAIRTVDGLRVFNWGGRWRSDPDAMHFQLNVSPGELARGLAP